ncbi:MAG: hypothetical protein ABT01_00730 [Clostridium sp. SCN 57-10]|nr:MAG: hypothetical protein ABT01_00730 [Clostridium sp. SCN 57-10]
MRLLFKQRFFSWLDSYDIYHEDGSVAFTVRGRLALGHAFEIYDGTGQPVGAVKQAWLAFLPRFELYIGDECVGEMRKQFAFFRQSYLLDYKSWSVEGDFLAWDYAIYDASGALVATAQKQLLNWTDTYVIDVTHSEDALAALMVVLAIDAEKCSDN